MQFNFAIFLKDETYRIFSYDCPSYEEARDKLGYDTDCYDFGSPIVYHMLLPEDFMSYYSAKK